MWSVSGSNFFISSFLFGSTSRIFLGTSQKYGLVKYDHLLSFEPRSAKFYLFIINIYIYIYKSKISVGNHFLAHLTQRFIPIMITFKSSPLKPLNQIKANLAGMVLGWSLFDILSDSAALHSKWLLLPKLEISLVVNFCFITNQNELKF